MSKVQGARSPKTFPKECILKEGVQGMRNMSNRSVLKYMRIANISNDAEITLENHSLLVVHIFKVEIQNLRHLLVRLFCWTFRIELQRF